MNLEEFLAGTQKSFPTHLYILPTFSIRCGIIIYVGCVCVLGVGPAIGFLKGTDELQKPVLVASTPDSE